MLLEIFLSWDNIGGKIKYFVIQNREYGFQKSYFCFAWTARRYFFNSFQLLFVFAIMLFFVRDFEAGEYAFNFPASFVRRFISQYPQ